MLRWMNETYFLKVKSRGQVNVWRIIGETFFRKKTQQRMGPNGKDDLWKNHDLESQCSFSSLLLESMFCCDTYSTRGEQQYRQLPQRVWVCVWVCQDSLLFSKLLNYLNWNLYSPLSISGLFSPQVVWSLRGLIIYIFTFIPIISYFQLTSKQYTVKHIHFTVYRLVTKTTEFGMRPTPIELQLESLALV